jgi:hypothetical protein
MRWSSCGGQSFVIVASGIAEHRESGGNFMSSREPPLPWNFRVEHNTRLEKARGIPAMLW